MNIKYLNTNKYEYIKNRFHVSDLCAKVLASKQLNDKEIEEILYSKKTLRDLNLSFLNPVIEKLQYAKMRNQKVLICGDYDCDGICATSIMYDALVKYGIKSGFYIPNRFNEGYGLHVNTVQLAIQKGYDIIFTVDNGVKAHDALKLAKENNIFVILTDHHAYDEKELIYDLFIHPNTMEEEFHYMCGAGVALLISRALIGHYDKHLILACIATIGDIVPLLNVNRMIVKEGLSLLNINSYLQIQKLANDNKKWDAKKIAFQIVPKLNCVGRLADIANVNNVVRYLCSKDPIMINDMARQLNELNEKRKRISAKMSEKATALIDDSCFQILVDESFHEGMNGIVASKLSNTFRKPVMVLSKQKEILKGSIRSNTIDLRDFFDSIKEKLISYGGHKEAAGISFAYDDLPKIKEYVLKKCEDYNIEDEIEVLYVHKKEINEESITSLNILEPFGAGFEYPLFYIEDNIQEVTTLSRNAHLKLKSDSISYLYFNHGNDSKYYSKNNKYGFIGKVEINEFFQHKSLNVIVEYIHKEDI